MAIEHSTISTGNLHEPKGVASATADQVYVADGSGSGSWKTPYATGVEDYNHAGAALTPALGVKTKVLNDAAGAYTNKAYKIPGYPDIWNPSTNQFDWSHLSLGDSVDIRFDFTVTTSGTHNDTAIILRAGVGGSPYDLTTITGEWQASDTYSLTVWYSVYMGDTNTLSNPAEVYVMSTTAGEIVQCNGWYVRTNKRTTEYI